MTRTLRPLPAVLAAVFLLILPAAPAQAETCQRSLDQSSAFGTASKATKSKAKAGKWGSVWSVGPQARPAFIPGITGTVIITELAKGALSGAGAQGYGFAMQQIGIGGPNYEAQLTRLEEELRSANRRLDQLKHAVGELQGVVSQASFSNLVAQAVPIISQINYVQDEIKLLPIETKSEQKREARRILAYICSHLLDKQTELNERIVGTAPTADNLITASSKAARDSVRYWRAHQTQTVRRVLEYYIEYEALLLQLRVEWWHAIGKSKDYILAQIDKVKQDVETQHALLKPGIERPSGAWERGQHYFVDTKNPGLVWWPIRVYDVLGVYHHNRFVELEGFVSRDFAGDWEKLGLQPFTTGDFYTGNLEGTYGFPGYGTRGNGVRYLIRKPGQNREVGVYGVGRIHYDVHGNARPRVNDIRNDGHEWRLATFDEAQALINGWTGSPGSYLRANMKPSPHFSTNWYDWGKVTSGEGVIWTRSSTTCCGYRLVDLRNGNTSGAVDLRNTSLIAGAFAVRPANPKGYWYN